MRKLGAVDVSARQGKKRAGASPWHDDEKAACGHRAGQRRERPRILDGAKKAKSGWEIYRVYRRNRPEG